MSAIDLSIVVPLYNERANVAPLDAAIREALAPCGLRYEVLLVDDGSIDGTFDAAAALPGAHPQVCVIKLRKNYGQTAAMAAGIERARGRVIVTMDGDLQNDPGDIPEFLRKLDEGYELVVGWRHTRKDKFVSRKLPSRVANWLIGKVTGVPIKDSGCSLKAYRAEVIKQIPLYSEMHRFIPAMASLAGSRVAEIKVRHHARRFGESKYGLSRVYRVLLDLVTVKAIVGFSSRPLAWFALAAAPVALLAAACIAASVYAAAIGASFRLPLAGAGMLAGALAVFLVMTGVLAELVHKVAGAKGAERLPLITARRL